MSMIRGIGECPLSGARSCLAQKNAGLKMKKVCACAFKPFSYVLFSVLPFNQIMNQSL